MNGATQLIAKADTTDASLGVVFGYAVVSTEKGEDYFDTQGENVPVGVITKAFVDSPGQVLCKAQHDGDPVGRIVFAMPITGDGDLVSKSEKTGLYVGAKFDQAVLDQFESGELTGFSIAGSGVAEEVD